MKEKIIGRKQEKELLGKIFQSGKPEFVAVCGRRRIGKTFLIKEFYEDELFFKTSGLANSNMKSQLKAFYEDMIDAGLPRQESLPSDWLDAFSLLRTLIRQSDSSKRKVILLDELPWMDTPKSGFLSALEHFWNVWGSERNDLVLVVCGSATSWMMDKLINNHGGLHNRLTRKIFLSQFSLGECEEFMHHKGFFTSRYDIAVLYMILGGIPYYLDLLDSSLSLTQNIDQLLFRKNGALNNEFANLYASLFKNSDDYVKVVEVLSSKRKGLTRNEIIASSKISSGNGLTTILRNLESCSFIRHYPNYQSGKRSEVVYQLMDFFTIFHFHFLRDKTNASWENLVGKNSFYTWAGITFEMLVIHHIDQIKTALGISGVQTNEYSWSCKTEEGRGAQIDLVIDRADMTVNLCDIKFSISKYSIDRDYEMVLRNKISQFMEYTKHKKTVIPTFISTYGLEHGIHSNVMSKEIQLDELF